MRAARPQVVPGGRASARSRSANAPSRSSVIRFTAARPSHARQRRHRRRSIERRLDTRARRRHGAQVVEQLAPAGRSGRSGRRRRAARPRPRSTRRAPARSGSRAPAPRPPQIGRRRTRIFGTIEVLGVQRRVALRKPCGRPPMQLAPSGPEQRVVDGIADQGVGEQERVAAAAAREGGATRRCSCSAGVRAVAQRVEREALARTPKRPAAPACRPAPAGPCAPGPGSAPSPAPAPRRSPRRGAAAARGTADCRRRARRSAGRSRCWPRGKRSASAWPRRARSGPRSMVSERAAAGPRPRQAWSSGSPSMREVMTRSAGHAARRRSKAARWSRVGRSAQCTSSTSEQERRALAGLAHQLRHRLPLAAAARRVVHRVVERAQLGRLGQVEQVVQKDPALRGLGHRQRRPARRRRCGRRRVAAAAQPEQAAHQRADRVLAARRAEVEHQPGVARETDALRPGAGTPRPGGSCRCLPRRADRSPGRAPLSRQASSMPSNCTQFRARGRRTARAAAAPPHRSTRRRQAATGGVAP